MRVDLQNLRTPLDVKLAFLIFLLFSIPVFAASPSLPIFSPAAIPPSVPVPLPVLTPPFSLPPVSVPALSLPHAPYPYVTPPSSGRTAAGAEAVRMANFARQQDAIERYIDPVLRPLNRHLNTPLINGAPSTSRIVIAPNPADFELVFERRRMAESTEQRFISSARANDAANLARLYADSLAVDPAHMTDAQKADMARFIAQFKALQQAYRAAWEKSVAGRNPAPDPKKPYQQAIFALNRILQEAYDTTNPGSGERAAVTAFLMRVAEEAPIDGFIRAYLVPKTGADLLAEAVADGQATVVDASGPDGLDALVDAIRSALGRRADDGAWSMTSELRFYGFELRYFPSASARPGRDVQIVITDGPHAGHYMWLADYIRAGYPRDF